MRKTLLLFFALPLIPLLLPHSTPNKGFSLEAISADLPFNPAWETRALNDEEKREVDLALAQPYKYLGAGSQCYSFVSEDSKYVIKFVKQKPFEIPGWSIGWLREKKENKKEAKRNRVFQAFKISFDLLPEETGLLYVHMNQTHHLNKTVPFCDSQGKIHDLNLDSLEFVIQKKADLAYYAIDALMENKEIEKAKDAIDQLLALNLKLYKQGFINRDPNFRSNCGFIDHRAIVIDIGRMAYREEIKKPENYKQELIKITPKFRAYISSRHPELLSHFDQSVADIIK